MMFDKNAPVSIKVELSIFEHHRIPTIKPYLNPSKVVCTSCIHYWYDLTQLI